MIITTALIIKAAYALYPIFALGAAVDACRMLMRKR